MEKALSSGPVKNFVIVYERNMAGSFGRRNSGGLRWSRGANLFVDPDRGFAGRTFGRCMSPGLRHDSQLHLAVQVLLLGKGGDLSGHVDRFLRSHPFILIADHDPDGASRQFICKIDRAQLLHHGRVFDTGELVDDPGIGHWSEGRRTFDAGIECHVVKCQVAAPRSSAHGDFIRIRYFGFDQMIDYRGKTLVKLCNKIFALSRPVSPPADPIRLDVAVLFAVIWDVDGNAEVTFFREIISGLAEIFLTERAFDRP